MAEEKFCPQCNTKMDYRLGVYECPSCGHTEERAATPAAEQKASGPGFRPEPWQQAQQQRASGPVPAPGSIQAPSMAPLAGPAGGTGDYYNPYPTLYTEKIVFFSLQVIGWVVNGIMVLVFSSMLSTMGPGTGAGADLGVGTGAIILLAVIMGAISLGLWYLVLFTEQLWAKYCCGGCLVLLVLISIPSIFVSNQEMSGIAAPGMGSYQMISTGVSVLLWIWVLWILWRDIQVVKGQA